jgi:RNA polymerase sigma-70 factor (ECF subfamily)
MAELPSDSSTRPSPLVRLRDADDGESWQTFVRTYAPLVYRYCRKQGAQDADAGDVAQEVLADIARSMQTFEYRPERGRFRDWLRTVTRRHLGRFFERQGRAVRGLGGESEGPEDLAAADAGWADEFNAQVLAAALEQAKPGFEPETWAAFERVWLHDRSALEAAAELGLPIDKVYTAKSRVLRRLREEVLHLAEDVPHSLPL